jgi:hypothetical protein
VVAWRWGLGTPPVALCKGPASRRTAAFAALVKPWAGLLGRDGDGGDGPWGQTRQTGRAPLLRRARGGVGATASGAGRGWAPRVERAATGGALGPCPTPAGEVQPWDARLVHRRQQDRARQDEAGQLARTLARELGALGRFVVANGVDPPHNRAERARRCAVLWRQLRQGPDHEQGDRWGERLLARREPCRLRGLRTFPGLVDAVAWSFNGQQPDISWIE